MLLNVAKSTSYEDLRTVAGVMYPTFKMLLWHLALETTMSGVRLLEKHLSGDQLLRCVSFSLLYLFGSVCDAASLFSEFYTYFTEDIHHKIRGMLQLPSYIGSRTPS